MLTITKLIKSGQEEFARSIFWHLTPEDQISVKHLAKERKKSLGWAVDRLLMPDAKPLKGRRFVIAKGDEKSRDGHIVFIGLSDLFYHAVIFSGLTSEEADIARVVAKTLLEFLGARKGASSFAPRVDEVIKKHSTPSETEARALMVTKALRAHSE